MGDKLFGTLHTPLKPLHYDGLETDTIEVIVDKHERTIAANLREHVRIEIYNTLSITKKRLEEVNQALIDLTAAVDAKLLEFDDTAIENWQKLDAAVQALFSEFGTKVDNLIAETTQQRDELIAAINAAWEAKEAIINTTLDIVDGKISETDAKLAEVDAKLVEVNNTIADKLTEVDATVAAHSTKLTELESNVEDAITQMTGDFTKLEDELKSTLDATTASTKDELFKATNEKLGVLQEEVKAETAATLKGAVDTFKVEAGRQVSGFIDDSRARVDEFIEDSADNLNAAVEEAVKDKAITKVEVNPDAEEAGGSIENGTLTINIPVPEINTDNIDEKIQEIENKLNNIQPSFSLIAPEISIEDFMDD